MAFEHTVPLNTTTIYAGDTKNITLHMTDLPRRGGSYALNGELSYAPVVDTTIKLSG
jgi:hypothetical protein